MTITKISNRTAGEELMIILEFSRLKINYNLSNDEIKNICETLTKPITEKEKELLDKCYSEVFSNN